MTQRATETLKHDVFQVADIHAKRFWLKLPSLSLLCTCSLCCTLRLRGDTLCVTVPSEISKLHCGPGPYKGPTSVPLVQVDLKAVAVGGCSGKAQPGATSVKPSAGA